MLSEISQRKTSTVWYHFYVESKKYNRLVRVTEKEADLQRPNSQLVTSGRWGWYRARGLGAKEKKKEKCYRLKKIKEKKKEKKKPPLWLLIVFNKKQTNF